MAQVMVLAHIWYVLHNHNPLNLWLTAATRMYMKDLLGLVRESSTPKFHLLLAMLSQMNPATMKMEHLGSALRVSLHFVDLPWVCNLLTLIDIIMVREVRTQHNFGDKPYLGFEHVTMTPMCRKLIDPLLLTADEKEWLNDYHTEVFEKTKSYFEKDQLTLAWLKRETQPY
jgi:hypothetical protein